MERVLVASDLSIRSDRAVGRAVRLAARLNLELTVLHVVDSAMPPDMAEMVNERAKIKLERFVASRTGAQEIAVEVLSTVGDPVHTILDTVDLVKADLLVVGIHRPRAFLDTFRETTMERLVRISAKPTLLVTDASDHDFEKVLAAVDMSPASTKAIQTAHQLFPTAEFSLFHGLHIPFKGLTGDASTEARIRPYMEEAERMMDSWLSTCNFPESIPRPTIIEGSPTMALGESMAKFRPDLLTLGVHSRAGVGRWLLGGFTKDLVRDPPCDMLITR